MDSSTADRILDLADRVFTSIEQGDTDAVRACYAEDMTVWTNFDDRPIDVDRAVTVVGWVISRVEGLRYDVTRREVLSDGFLQQHVLRGTGPDGSEVAIPACIVATVNDDGLVVRMEEYLDPAAVAALK